MDTELVGGRVVLMTTSPLNLTGEKSSLYNEDEPIKHIKRGNKNVYFKEQER